MESDLEMSDGTNCNSKRVAAFLDGEFDAAERSAFETHLSVCAACADELRQQQLFMCELESMFTSPVEMDVPPNFAEVIAVRAESDMRGVRDRSEHKRALLFSVLLALSAFVLLGLSTSEDMLRNAQSAFIKTLGILELLGKTAYDAAAGFTVILRVLGGGLVADSRFAGLTILAFVVLALGLLSLLIARYHRTRITE